MSRRDQSLIAFMVGVFCLVAAANALINPRDGAMFGAGIILGVLGASCLWAGVSLRRDPPA